MKRVIGLVVVAGSALGIALGGCSKSDSSDQGSTPTVVAANATILDASSSDDVTVQTGKLLFPKATHADIGSKKAGDVLVGDAGVSPGSPNPFGFLRKVVSVTDDGTSYVVTTTQGTLLDVVDQGELSGTITVPSLQKPSGTASTKGLLTPKGGPMKLLDFSGTTLFHDAESVTVSTGKTIGYDATVTLTIGTLDFTPSFDVGAKVTPKLTLDLKKWISEAHVIAKGDLEATAQIDASLKLTSTATGDDIAALIAEKIFKKSSSTIADYDIKLPGLKLGPIDVPAHAHFTTVINCDLRWSGETAVTFGGTASVQVSAGATWDGSTISPVFDHTETLDKIGPTFTIADDLGLSCTITPKFELELWDVASGDITAEAYAAVDAQAVCDTSKLTGDVSGIAFAGADAKAHAKLDVFGLFSWEKECTLFDVRTPVASFSGSIPLGSGSSCAKSDPPAAPPELPPAGDGCFGDTSTGTDAGPGDDTGLPLDTGPVDDGGADADDSDGADTTLNCDHDSCTLGGPLSSTCDKDGQGGACIASICANDDYCCNYAWTASCVAHVTNGDYACIKKTCP
jgi:hypothetical protein